MQNRLKWNFFVSVEHFFSFYQLFIHFLGAAECFIPDSSPSKTIIQGRRARARVLIPKSTKLKRNNVLCCVLAVCFPPKTSARQWNFCANDVSGVWFPMSAPYENSS